MIDIAVVGARGRMSRLIIEAINQDKEVHLCAQLSRSDSQDLQQIKFPIDVVVDFTVPAATLEHLAICKERGFRMVIGTTGFNKAEQALIAEAANVIPIVFAPNMSIGVNLSYKLLEIVAKVLKGKVDVAILDIHHKHKKDAPSGTALKMAEVIKNASDSEVGNCGISSTRVGEVVGEHSALFFLNGERLEITHRATDRFLFAKGAIHAAKWLINKEAGLYDMQDVLELRDTEYPS